MTTLLDRYPLAAVFLVTVFVVLVSAMAGHRIGARQRRREDRDPEGPVGAVVGTVLGLLAFILAFTFSLTAGRYDTRKQLLLDEVNGIRAAWLRAGLLPEDHRESCRALLKQYVDVRVTGSTSADKVGWMIQESEAIHARLWEHAQALARADMNSDIGALFVESMNELVTLQTSRATIALQYRIPSVVWGVLAGLTVLSMAGVGYHFGLLGRSSAAALLILAFSFGLVVGLISDLDHAVTGQLKVSQRPMQDLQLKMAPPATPAAP